MLVKDLMTTDPLTISPEAPVSAAARLLSRYNLGVLPVAGNGKQLCGVLTDRDIVLRCVAAEKAPEKTTVREIMTRRVLSAAPGDELEKAAQLMAQEQVRRLPVTDGGRLVGLLSLGDFSANREFAMEASACLAEICRNLIQR